MRLIEKFKDARGLVCCGCRRRFTRIDALYSYKSVCLCGDCFNKFDKVSGNMRIYNPDYNLIVYSPFIYRGLLRDLFIAFKFKGMSAYGHIIGMAVGEAFFKHPPAGRYDFITYVPLSKQRYNERGYNQSEIISRYLCRALNVPCKELLIRTVAAVRQSSMRNIERMRNVRNAFAVCDDVKDKRIILLDDIHTSGSTIHECQKTLLDAGAKDVCLITAAFVKKSRDNREEEYKEIVCEED